MSKACITRPLLALGLFAALAAGPAAAEDWPSREVRLIVPYAPGGVYDRLVRPIAQELAKSLGQPVLVENRPGANTAIGTGTCASGPADGYTFCASGNSVILNDLLRRMPFDWEKDLAPVSNLVALDGVIVAHASLPFDSLPGLVAYAKKNPGKLNFGSFGEGSPGHLYIEWIKNAAGIDVVHVPYKGAAPVIQATLGNEVQLTYMATGAILPHIKSGRLKPIVMPAPERSPYLPNVPTLAEQGFDFKPTAWIGLFAAAKTPRAVLARMHAEVRRILLDPQFRAKVIEPQFYTVIASSPDEFARFLKGERRFVGELVRISGLKTVE